MSFGKRVLRPAPPPAPDRPENGVVEANGAPPLPDRAEPAIRNEGEERYEDAKRRVFGALIDAVDLAELSRLGQQQLRAEIDSVVGEIVGMRNLVLSAAEQERLIKEIGDDVLGFGPLEPLLARDDIDDIMVNAWNQVYIERNGRVEPTNVRFRDSQQLMNICQRIVSAVGRRVDEASPICDARLADGSRVNVIVPPLALDSPVLTIRKFRRDKLTLERLVELGTMTPQCARLLRIAAASRCNILISGGTGSGKTTLLNCLTRFIGSAERVVTCEDAAELQLQQPHVVRLETRPPNLEGIGEVTMRDLVRNCLRMRPDRIIVGEVRGEEAFDLLQAMNTGHDGSMGTVHANNPRDALARLENMVAMAGLPLPVLNVRKQIASSIEILVHVQRLRDGSRKLTHLAEIVGMEGEVVTLQSLVSFEFLREDEHGRIVGRHRSSGLRPNFWDRARYFGLERELAEAMEERSVA